MLTYFDAPEVDRTQAILHRVYRIDRQAGYACTRAAASLGIFDVIGIRPTEVVLVQCKTRDWPSMTTLSAS